MTEGKNICYDKIMFDLKRGAYMWRILVFGGVLMAVVWPCLSEAVELQPMFYHNPVYSVSIREPDKDGEQPQLKVVFKEQMTQQQVRDSVYVVSTQSGAQPVAFDLAPQPVTGTETNLLNPRAHELDQPTVDGKLPAHKTWLLKPRTQLPAGTVFSVKVRNTSPPSAATTVQDVVLYQFKTDKTTANGKGSLFKKIFDPIAWHGCEGDNC